jgi:copper chaperone CopZ
MIDTPPGYLIPSQGISPKEYRVMSETVTYRVPGMSCEHCRAAVTNELSSVAGVESVAVDLDEKLVTVHGGSLDDAALRAAIDEAGYEVA